MGILQYDGGNYSCVGALDEPDQQGVRASGTEHYQVAAAMIITASCKPPDVQAMKLGSKFQTYPKTLVLRLSLVYHGTDQRYG